MPSLWLGLPFKCVCGHGFDVEHAMNCSSGGFPTIRHNELRDFTATVLSDDVAIELVLQRLSGENLQYATENEAHLDVSAKGFWGGRHQRGFFNIRVFNPTASSYRDIHIASLDLSRRTTMLSRRTTML